MHNDLAESPAPAPAVVGMSLAAAADLQDHLVTATHDLDRLQTLLSDACEALQASFFGATAQLDELGAAARLDAPTVRRAQAELGTAVTALQFQDMAAQLIKHTRSRLRNCADRLACDAFAGDEEGGSAVEQAPLRPNPVTQSEMDTGFIELF